MDKKQATNHILNRLRAGYGSGEITEELSRILKAPPEVVEHFVSQVTASHPEINRPAPGLFQATDDFPDWMPKRSSNAAPASPVAAAPVNPNSDLPPGLQRLLNGEEPEETEPIWEVSRAPDNDLPQRATFVTSAEISHHSNSPDESLQVNLEELSKTVLSQLKKRRRHNDVVEYVCRQTGWHWNKSQRFVARVQTQNHELLQAGQNRTNIFVGIGIIIVGLIIALNGVVAIADYAKLATFAQTNPGVLLDVSPQGIFFALAASVTGLGMIIGGGYGVGRAMVNH